MEDRVSQLSLSSESPPEASKQRKKKKKKKKSRSKPLSLLAANSNLPSQKVVEERFPWRIIVRPRRGRCAIASRDIKVGELIISEQALSFVLRSSYRTVACHSCCKDFSETSPGILCQDCNYTLVCEECRHLTIRQHSECCAVLQKVADIAAKSDCDGDLLRLALLLDLQRNTSSSEPNQVISDGLAGEIKGDILHPSFQDAMGLQTHKDRVSESWKSSVKKGCEMLIEEAANHVKNFQSSTEDLEYLAALINANAHGMGAQGPHNTDIAIGIFPFVSMLNHSCRPNCCFSSDKNVMYIRATQHISKDTELCLSYINLYEARATRREELAATKYFECACARCIEPLSSSVDRFLEGLLCQVKGCGGVLVKTWQEETDVPANLHLMSWQCDTCLGVFDPLLNSGEIRPLAERPWDVLKLAQEKLCAAISVYKDRRFGDARMMLENFLTEFTGKLHPLHVLLFDALTPLMNCCRVLGDAEGGAKVCRMIINCLEKVLDGPSLELANFYFCLGEMYSERAESVDISPILAKRLKKQAQETFNQVRHLRSICLGKGTQVPRH